MTAAEEYRQVAGSFTSVVRGAGPEAWDAPAPVAGWAARDVVRHLVEWFPAFLESGSEVRLPAGPSVDDDPVAAWVTMSDGVQALLDDPGAQGQALSNPHLGEVPLPEAVSRFFTADVFMHTWDLARATGQAVALDEQRCEEMLAGMEAHEDAMRGSGQYGPRVEVAPGSDAQTRLLGFIGRDPYWRARAGA